MHTCNNTERIEFFCNVGAEKQTGTENGSTTNFNESRS
jgi:hypothetical protein